MDWRRVQRHRQLVEELVRWPLQLPRSLVEEAAERAAAVRWILRVRHHDGDVGIERPLDGSRKLAVLGAETSQIDAFYRELESKAGGASVSVKEVRVALKALAMEPTNRAGVQQLCREIEIQASLRCCAAVH